MKKEIAIKTIRCDILCILIIMGCEILFFHNILFNDNLIGYRIDGRLVTFLTEHWYQVFQGKEGWTELPCFYPEEGILAYSDMMLLFALPFSFLRTAGMNMYSALKATTIIFHVLGSVTLYYFMRKFIKVSGLLALLAVVCFSFSNGYNFISGNIQMFALSLLPVLLIAIGLYVRNFERKYRYFAGIFIIVWLALLFYTAFYVGYFICLFAGITVVVFGGSAFLLRKQEWMRSSWNRIIRHWKEYIFYFMLFILLMLPFVYLYLPALQDFGGRSWEELLGMFPSWKNICMLNEKSDALAGFNPEVYNYKTGFPITDLIIYGFSGVYFCYTLKKKIKKDGWSKEEYVLLSGMVVIAISFILIIQFRGITLWYFVYKLIPGASAIRAVLRWLNFISLPMAIYLAIIMAYLGKTVLGKKRKIYARICLLGLIAIVYLGNYCVTGVGSGWTASGEILFEESVAVPPSDCEVMYIVDQENVMDVEYQELQMDAWAVALKYDLKTINGYSGQVPNGWDLLDPSANDIDQKVKDWLAKNNKSLQGVYAYDIGQNEWEKLN